jgi:hypothetical protein
VIEVLLPPLRARDNVARMHPRLLPAVLAAGLVAACAGEPAGPAEPSIGSERRPLIGGEVPTPESDIDPAAVALTTPSKFSF